MFMCTLVMIQASEQQRLYTEALKEAEEAKAESQYHEEQFTRMAIETSKVLPVFKPREGLGFRCVMVFVLNIYLNI